MGGCIDPTVQGKIIFKIIIIIIIITDIYNAPCLSHSDTPSADGPSSSFHIIVKTLLHFI